LADNGYVELEDLHHRLRPILTAKGRSVLPTPTKSGPALQAHEVREGEQPIPVWPISCGPLKDSTAEPEYLTSPAQLFRNWRHGDYLLRGDGDSMEHPSDPEQSISDGDWIQVRPGIAPANGEVVHAEFESDGEYQCTLKVFHIDREGIVTLRALNPSYADIILPGQHVTVRGVVLETLRCMSRTSTKK